MENLTPMQDVFNVLLDTDLKFLQKCMTLMERRENFLEDERQLTFEFVEWLEKLPPNKKVSVWSKDGSTQGLFSMDTEQLYDVFLRERQ